MVLPKIKTLTQNVSAQAWQKIAQIDELKGQWVGAANLHPRILGRLKQSVLITSTGASTRIEGAKLSDEEIEKMMRGIKMQKFINRDRQEVRGYFELLTNVFAAYDSLHFSEGLIKHFHQELLQYVAKDELHRVTPKAMTELSEEVKSLKENHTLHPLLVIAAFVVLFLQIHPFQDGNGRLSRILTNLLLLQAGYRYVPYVSHEKIIEDNKADYYLALRKTQQSLKKEPYDFTSWLNFFLEVVLTQVERAVALLDAAQIETLLSPRQLQIWQFLQQQTRPVAPRHLEVALNIPRSTINQVLAKLLKLKKIERLGQGRAVRYRVQP